MTITDAITDTCRCGHPWHEDACTDRRTVADIRGGTKREDCKCPSGRALTDPAEIGPSHFYVIHRPSVTTPTPSPAPSTSNPST
jgi:hypothetical protein